MWLLNIWNASGETEEGNLQCYLILISLIDLSGHMELVATDLDSTALDPCYSKCGLWTSRLCIPLLVCWKYRLSGSTLGLLIQKLYVNKIPRLSICTLKFKNGMVASGWAGGKGGGLTEDHSCDDLSKLQTPTLGTVVQHRGPSFFVSVSPPSLKQKGEKGEKEKSLEHGA